MKKKLINDVKLGAFILGALIVFLAAMYYIGGQTRLFGQDVRVHAVFNNVSGLQVGNNVRLSGIKVGTVYELSIISDSSVKVTMMIEKKAARYIKSDAQAIIESEGLMGNKVIAITGGSAQSPVIEDGDRIASKNAASIDAAIETFTLTSGEVQKLASELTEIVRGLNRGEGALGSLIADPTLESRVDTIALAAQRSGEEILDAVNALNRTAHNINAGEGLITRLLYDTAWAARTGRVIDSIAMTSRNLTVASDNIRQFTEELTNPDGTLHMLLTDSAVAEDLEQTISNVQQGSDDLERAVQTVENSWILNLFSGKKKKEREQKSTAGS